MDIVIIIIIIDWIYSSVLGRKLFAHGSGAVHDLSERKVPDGILPAPVLAVSQQHDHVETGRPHAGRL